MKVHAKVQKWGNGLAIRISGVMRDVPNFHAGSEVDVVVTEKGLNITKSEVSKKVNLPYSEKDLLAGLNKQTAHADSLAILSKKELGE